MPFRFLARATLLSQLTLCKGDLRNISTLEAHAPDPLEGPPRHLLRAPSRVGSNGEEDLEHALIPKQRRLLGSGWVSSGEAQLSLKGSVATLT